MKQQKKTPTVRKINKGSAVLLAAAVVLLLVGTIGTARAALTYFSENYTARMEVNNIGVTLVENGVDIVSRNYGAEHDDTGVLLGQMLNETDGKLRVGRAYKEELAVKNSGTIDQYVRVRIFRYWTQESGGKETTLAPALIDLNLTENGWIQDVDASTEERMVLYYPQVLRSGATTPLFADRIRIDDAVAAKVNQETSTDENGQTTITTTYEYDGVQFNLEAEVDAVQNHNAADAIKSAWGVDVNISSDGQLSLQ